MLSVDFCLHLTGQSCMTWLVLGDWEPVVTFPAFLVKAGKENMNDNGSGISINNLPRGPTKSFHCFILPTRHKNTTNSHLLFSSFHKMKELLTLQKEGKQSQKDDLSYILHPFRYIKNLHIVLSFSISSKPSENFNMCWQQS